MTLKNYFFSFCNLKYLDSVRFGLFVNFFQKLSSVLDNEGNIGGFIDTTQNRFNRGFLN